MHFYHQLLWVLQPSQVRFLKTRDRISCHSHERIEPSETLQILQQRIIGQYNILRQNHAMIRSEKLRYIRERAQCCNDQNGGYVKGNL